MARQASFTIEPYSLFEEIVDDQDLADGHKFMGESVVGDRNALFSLSGSRCSRSEKHTNGTSGALIEEQSHQQQLEQQRAEEFRCQGLKSSVVGVVVLAVSGWWWW